ncbi:MAG: hypothetical protein ACYC8T_12075 [Myxococcaceae bacterium]
MKPSSLWGALAGACLLAAPALAQSYDDDPVPLDVRLNLGLLDYTGDLGVSTQVGGLYGVTLGFQSRGLMGLLGAEAGYEGSYNSVAGEGTGALVRHDVNGLVKIGPMFELRERDRIKPFVGVGVGVSYVNATNDAETVGLHDDWMAEIPLAAGVEYRVGLLTAGVRGTWRVLAFDEFAGPGPDTDNPPGSLASGSITFGGVF